VTHSQSNPDHNTLVKAGPGWIWGLPLICLCLIFVIQLSGTNRSLFFLLNELAAGFGDKFWSLLTCLANGLVAFVLLLPWIHRKPQYIWAVLIASLLFTVFGQAIKHLTHLPRPPAVLSPDEFLLIGPALKQNAFPSGHASTAFILGGVFSLTTNKKWVRILLIFFASWVAFSRVAVGVHWPRDVIAGAILGWVFVWAGLKLTNCTKWGWTGIGQKILGILLLALCVLLFISYNTGYTNVLWEQRIFALIFFAIGIFEYLKIYKP